MTEQATFENIGGLQNKKSHDCYGLSKFFIKTNNPAICSTLTVLFNRILEEEFYPECLKLAKIIPIHKSKKKESNTNYRPISLLLVSGKVFEKNYRIVRFLYKNEVFSSEQRFSVKTINSCCNCPKSI